MNDRAVSVTVGYAMNLALMTILLSGLFIASGNLIASERERAATDELDVIGQRIATELMAVDRLAMAANNDTDTTIKLRVELPEQVAGSEYTIEIHNDEDELELSTTELDTKTRVPFVTNGSVVFESTVRGGDLIIERSGGGLEVASE